MALASVVWVSYEMDPKLMAPNKINIRKLPSKFEFSFVALFISYRSRGEKLIKYHANSSCVIMSVILMTTQFYKALVCQRKTWCWSLLGLLSLKWSLRACISASWPDYLEPHFSFFLWWLSFEIFGFCDNKSSSLWVPTNLTGEEKNIFWNCTFSLRV